MYTDRDPRARIVTAAVTVTLALAMSTSAQSRAPHVGAALPRTSSATGKVNVLHSFTGADGSNPQGGLQYGFHRFGKTLTTTIFGTSQTGGATGNGTVFSQGTQGSAPFADRFGFNGANGAFPAGGLAGVIDDDTLNGPFFGVTRDGGKYGLRDL